MLAFLISGAENHTDENYLKAPPVAKQMAALKGWCCVDSRMNRNVQLWEGMTVLLGTVPLWNSNLQKLWELELSFGQGGQGFWSLEASTLLVCRMWAVNKETDLAIHHRLKWPLGRKGTGRLLWSNCSMPSISRTILVGSHVPLLRIGLLTVLGKPLCDSATGKVWQFGCPGIDDNLRLWGPATWKVEINNMERWNVTLYTGALTPRNSRTLVCFGFSAQLGLHHFGPKVIILIFRGKSYSKTTTITTRGLNFDTQISFKGDILWLV